MNTSRRVFYVVYPRNEHLQRVLDSIRYLADPEEKTRAHITLRGPYKQKQNLTKLFENTEVEVTGVDAFVGPRQNTVFFTLLAPGLQNAWYKPDYPAYRPHLTIYDGDSKDFATGLWSRLDALRPNFRFLATGLEPLVTSKGQGTLELRAAYDEELVKELTGCAVSSEEVKDLPLEKRVDLIAALCARLGENGTRSTP